MPQWLNDQRRWFRPVLVGLMITLLLALDFLASDESAHFKLHQGDTSSHATCAVCALAKGMVDASSPTVTLTAVKVSFAWIVPALTSVLVQEPDFSVASSRGPPASVSSL